MKAEWQILSQKMSDDGRHGTVCERMKVGSGWVVRTFTWDDAEQMQSEGLCFVPDIAHRWEVE